MDRYSRAFYEPLVADWSNFGTWQERGAKTASERAIDIWERILDEFQPPGNVTEDRVEELDAFIARRTEEGGASPQS